MEVSTIVRHLEVGCILFVVAFGFLVVKSIWILHERLFSTQALPALCLKIALFIPLIYVLFEVFVPFLTGFVLGFFEGLLTGI